MKFDLGNRLIVALDVPDAVQALALSAKLDGTSSWMKIGLQLFIAEGPQLVRDFVCLKRRIMLDLKLHDIPNTVEEAAKSAADLGVEMITVHTGGGPKMLEAAVRGAGADVKVLGVTVLTSMDHDDLAAVGVHGDPVTAVRDTVLRRVRLAEMTGCAGVVASPHEARMARLNTTNKDFLVVTPGIRPAGTASQDQKRIMTPAEALSAGASMIVVGRPIRNAEDPRAAALAIAEELSK